MTWRIGIVLIAVGGVLAAGCGEQPQKIESSFAEGAEGWTIAGDAQEGSSEPVFRESGGNPGGHVSAADDVTGGVWFWNAPSRYLGDRTGYYGGTLSFDLRQSDVDSQFDNPDVVLASDSLEIQYQFEDHPGTRWTHYEVVLRADRWNGADTGEPVTEDRMREVLSNLQELRIRGEYREGADTGRLDNVVLAP